MSDNRNAAEQHGCIVCGKMHSMLVVYGPGGNMLDCTATSAGAQRVRDAHRPLVACDTHGRAAIEAAYVSHYPGRQSKDDDDDG